ncbi:MULTISPECIES: Lrp/AsnC ligand binding domain-containing protein [unclassified Mesorhizobium]|uniref:Lrp/AsnC ligand binding domain-containing protein n=1 Tax=unclassified Mesorhizobium TaxID=325217 RepID=UPI00313E55AB
MLVYINLERDRTDILDRFKQAVRRTPEITCAYNVTGETDFVLVISVSGYGGVRGVDPPLFFRECRYKEI